MGTKRSPGDLSLLSLFTHTLSLIMILGICPYNSLNLESQNQSKNILMAIPGSLINILGISVKGLRVIIGQTKRDYNFIYIDKPP